MRNEEEMMQAMELMAKIYETAPCLQFHFLGRYDDTKDYHTGDVVTKDGNPMVYTGDHFVDIIGGILSATKEEQQTETRCIYCGAPLIKHNNRIVCEYCDTQYT